ncbi:hypothetical protein SD37_33415 [Amycolatopsis orientalis]|uniref:AAA+ ATPase domain-containing protein n=1 Tax=Amycolatopsis orientalis TaxID=31958 RepID=A0A193C6F4_AMYOR|nr:hypothetical protein SD37_33415 [Amycolatopsis orientalis]
MLFGLGLLAVALVWWVVQVAFLPSDSRSTAATYGQFVLAAVGLAVSVAALWRTILPPSSVGLDELSDRFAAAMRAQAMTAAMERGLMQPLPLPLKWTGVSKGITGSVAGATAPRGAGAWFPPLPGLDTITSADLRMGNRDKLHRIYGALPSGRLILVGPPGSGKSSTAVLLQLDALRHRDAAADAHDRRRIPVPVILTLHGWDPESTPVMDWLVSRLTLVPMLRGRAGARHARALLQGHITVILDGLDEIPEHLRPTALRVLSEQATFRLILLSRTKEMADAARQHLLVGAVAVRLEPSTPAATVRYLLDPLAAPAPSAWKSIAATVKEKRPGPLASVLSSPLWASLLHDIYPPLGNLDATVDELLDTERFADSRTITQHLLDQAVAAAYTSRPAQKPSPYKPATVRRTLGVIASRLHRDSTRDFTWWGMIAWSPLSGRLVSAIPTVLFTIPAILAAAALIAVLAGDLVWVTLGAVAGIGLAAKFLAPAARYPLTLGGSFKSRNLRRGILLGLGLGLGFGLVAGSQGGFAGGFASGYVGGLGVCLPVGLVGGLTVGLLDQLAQQGRNDVNPPSPVKLWHAEVATAPFLILTFASAGALVFGLIGGVIGGADSVLEEGAMGAFIGTAIAVAVWTALSKTMRAACGQLYLTVRYRTPFRLVRFLEDARSRHILRTVGPVYQFRHATLQDHLAARSQPASPASTATASAAASPERTAPSM